MKLLTKARRQRKRRPKPMDLKTLSRVLTTAITKLEDHLLESTEVEEARKICHALATVAGSYTRLTEATELEARVEALEAAQEPQASTGMRRAA